MEFVDNLRARATSLLLLEFDINFSLYHHHPTHPIPQGFSSFLEPAQMNTKISCNSLKWSTLVWMAKQFIVQYRKCTNQIVNLMSELSRWCVRLTIFFYSTSFVDRKLLKLDILRGIVGKGKQIMDNPVTPILGTKEQKN